MHPRASELRFMTKNDGCVYVHPSSVNYTVRNNTPGRECEANGTRDPSVCRRFATTTAPSWFTMRR